MTDSDSSRGDLAAGASANGSYSIANASRAGAERRLGYADSMRIATIALATSIILMSGSLAAQTAERPVLVVVLVVDQLRADYLARFEHQWSHGLRRLMDESAWFRQAAYPYFNTVTCAGHATIATGSFPVTHGQFMNEWWDRESGTLVNCTDDSDATTIGYADPRPGGHSARRLLSPTLSDEMRTQLPVAARVVSLSLKVRSAVMLAGHDADLAAWFEGRTFASSSVYGPDRVPFLEQFLDQHPIERDVGHVWDRVQAAEAYLFPTSTPESKPQAGWGPAFPHPLGGPGGSPDGRFYAQWSRSPCSDRYLVEMAMAAIDEMKLGQEDRTDYLAIGLSALDRVGHDFGPRSHEVQDTLMQLDESLGLLLDHLDTVVGPRRYVLALTADHGVMPIPEQVATWGIDSGRVDVDRLRAQVDDALTPMLGAGPHVARVNHTELYFAPGVYDRLTTMPAALEAAMAAAASSPGVQAVYRTEDIPRLRASTRRVERALSLNHVPARSGDLIIVPKIYWTTSENAAGHGTAYEYDTRVPILLSGPGIRRGRFDTAATPADVAPTLAFLAGVTLAQPDGRVLVEALETAGPALPADSRP